MAPRGLSRLPGSRSGFDPELGRSLHHGVDGLVGVDVSAREEISEGRLGLVGAVDGGAAGSPAVDDFTRYRRCGGLGVVLPLCGSRHAGGGVE